MQARGEETQTGNMKGGKQKLAIPLSQGNEGKGRRRVKSWKQQKRTIRVAATLSRAQKGTRERTYSHQHTRAPTHTHTHTRTSPHSHKHTLTHAGRGGPQLTEKQGGYN